jgi:hypothetical protein
MQKERFIGGGHSRTPGLKITSSGTRVRNTRALDIQSLRVN